MQENILTFIYEIDTMANKTKRKEKKKKKEKKKESIVWSHEKKKTNSWTFTHTLSF